MASRLTRFFEALLLPLGLVALGVLVYEVGAQQILELTAVVRWWFLVILVQEFVAHGFNTAGLLACLPLEKLGFIRTFSARLAGEAVNATMPTATVGGELLKISLLARRAPLDRVTAGVSMAYASQALAQMLFTSMVLPLALPNLVYGLPVRIAFAVFVLGGLIATWWMSVLTRGGDAFEKAHALLRKIGLGREGSSMHEATKRIGLAARDVDEADPRAFSRATVLFFLGWCWGPIEVFLVLRACGFQADVTQCIAIEALSAFVDAVFFFVPGQMGTREGGLAGITYALGLGAPVGVSLGLVRRGRQLTWAAVGLLCLAYFRRREPLATEPVIEEAAAPTL